MTPHDLLHVHLGLDPATLVPALLAALQFRLLIWPLLFGFGVYLLLTSQPIGRPKRDLAERLRRLDVDARMRDEIEQLGRGASRPFFASRTVETMLRPILDDAGRMLQGALGRFDLFGLGGDAGGEELARRLNLV